MAIVSIDPRDPTPIYAQLERGLRAAIATGRLSPGDQLPTVRQLAVELKVNANTLIDQRSNPWGVTVQSVEMRDIVNPLIPAARAARVDVLQALRSE